MLGNRTDGVVVGARSLKCLCTSINLSRIWSFLTYSNPNIISGFRGCDRVSTFWIATVLVAELSRLRVLRMAKVECASNLFFHSH